MGPWRTLIDKGWWIVLLVLAAAGAWLGPWVPRLEVHAGTSVLLGESDPDLAFYERTRPLWGYDEYAIVCATRAGWIDAQGVALLNELVEELKAAAHASEVVSLLNVPLLRQSDTPGVDLRSLRTLLSPEIDFERARQELLEHTQARGNLISEDGRSVSLLVYLDVPEASRRLDPIWSRLRADRLTDPKAEAEMQRLRPETEAANAELSARRTALVDDVRAIARRWSQRLGQPVRLSGISVININLMEHLQHDLRVFGLASLAFFTLAFLLVYRKIRLVLLAMVSCLVPVTLIVGAMSRAGVRVTLITANLPLLLFTLMLPFAVYFIERYRERRSLCPNEPDGASIAWAAAQIAPPCIFSCTTTMAGFAALLSSDTLPVHDLGLYMVGGMGLGLVIVFATIAAISKPLPALEVERSGVQLGPRKLVRWFERAALQAPGRVVLASALVLVVSIWGATRLSAQSKFTEYFRSGSEVYAGLEYIDREMGGTTPLEIILESSQKNFFVTPQGLEALKATARHFDSVPETGNVRSLATLVDELKKKDERVVALLPLFAQHPLVRNVTREFANDDYTIARVLVRLRETAPTLHRDRVLAGLRAHLGAQPELQDLQVRETGVFLLYANMLNSLIRTQERTFLYVIAAIYLMLVLLFRSFLLAVLVLLPQLLPSLVTLGAMGWMGIPLDMVTVVIASIAMGVGIDAAIQYTFRFRAELEVDGDPRAALSRAHGTIGRAIWIATSVIVAGFLILVLSEFRPSMWFGLFTAVAMLVSQIAALTTLPAIFLLTGRPKPLLK